eukprot:CAMPEP_0198198676 /NCGR_PEP_ID=MMETSP1445-20131203/2112_1 /TAXON_ID=36898 /ORGANISM="Pyramimonas sp., Strain CCMP2087" /LENGTH=239 /DNA_ID=CAMNT_0043868305 /DNA_START=433 /DNA_END=1151 /DNA_ORIENTATION=-
MDFFDQILDQLIPRPAPTPNLVNTPAARTEMEPIVINSQNDGDSDDCKEVTVGDGYIRNRDSRTGVRNGSRNGATQDGEVILINDTSPVASNRRRSKRSVTTLPRQQSGYPSVPSGGPSRRGNVVDDSSDVEIIEPESVPSSSRPSGPQRAPKRPRPAFFFADVVEMPSPDHRQRKQRAAAPQPTAFQEPGSSGRDKGGVLPSGGDEVCGLPRPDGGAVEHTVWAPVLSTVHHEVHPEL